MVYQRLQDYLMVTMPDWNPKMPTVPVDKDGNWLNYPHHWQAVGWEPATKFIDAMEIDGMETGRSSKVVVLKSRTNQKTYRMFVKDLIDGISASKIHISDGVLTASWTASKRGANYGIKAV